MPDLAVRDQIVATLAAFTAGTNAFRGPVRPVGGDASTPARAIFCLLNDGDEPIQYHSVSSSATRRRTELPQVQVRVRGDSAGGFEQGQSDAVAARLAVHDSAPAASGPMAGFIDCMVVESAPSFLGNDDDGHPEWSFNVELKEAIP